MIFGLRLEQKRRHRRRVFLCVFFFNSGGLPFHHSGDLPDPGIQPTSLVSPALSSIFFTTAPPEKPKILQLKKKILMPSYKEKQ